MKAFVIKINGKKACTAGVGDDGVLTAIVSWVARDGQGMLDCKVGGLLTKSDKHVEWRTPPFRLGDEFSVGVVEAAGVDKPTIRTRSGEEGG